MKISPSYEAQRELSDGTRVRLRMIRPEDRHELRREFQRLTPESRYRRFFAHLHDLSDEMLTYLTEVDGVDHVAILALVDSLDLKTERGVGVGRFVRAKADPDVAEAAVTVVDDMQRRGVGRLLVAVLIEAARERGIRKFRGEVLASNEPVLESLRAAGAELRDAGAGTITFDVPIAPETEPFLWHAFREIAKSMGLLFRGLLGGVVRGPPSP